MDNRDPAMTFTLTHRQFTYRWEVTDVPDITGRGAAFVPHSIEIGYTKNARWSSWRAEVSGSRRLKSGAVGTAPMSIRYYSTDTTIDAPDWVLRFVKLHTPMGWET
jgi:hypothetical protein